MTMEMNLRDWLIILGVIAGMLVVADGLRRVWLYRRRANELNFGLENIQWTDDGFSSELPNGGARTASQGMGDETDGSEYVDNERAELFLSDESGSVSKHQSTERWNAFEGGDDGVASTAPVVEYDASVSNHDIHCIKEQQSYDLEKPVQRLIDVGGQCLDTSDPEHETASITDDVEPRSSLDVISAIEPEQAPEFSEFSAIEPEQSLNCSELSDEGILMPVEEVLIINLLAKEGEIFAGSDLCDLFMSEGLCFGRMNIFHRHAQRSGRGDVLFSVANGVEPGTFNLVTMNNDTTSALSFFMGLPGSEESDSMQVFNGMIDVVSRIAEALGALLKDEKRNVLTQQTVEYYRQRISDFERRRMIHRGHKKTRV